MTSSQPVPPADPPECDQTCPHCMRRKKNCRCARSDALDSWVYAMTRPDDEIRDSALADQSFGFRQDTVADDMMESYRNG